MTTTPTDFHEANRASEVLAKIGSGAADAEFARAVHIAIDRANMTMKKCRVRVDVDIEPDEKTGALYVSADVTTKLQKLRPPTSQMHLGANGQLLTQQDWLFGGGRDESPLQVKPTPIEQGAASSPSGRFKIVQPPAPAPLAAAPTPQPVAGKDAAAGEKA